MTPLQEELDRVFDAPILEQEDIPIVKEWAKYKKKLTDAQARYKEKAGKPRVLVIQGSDRNEDTCPQEKPKSLRLCERAMTVYKRNGIDATLLDLSRITAEKDLMIYPCKACFSTSPALCHFGCTCYPSDELNQGPDWLHDEIYELILENHALHVITPVYWYSLPSVLKLMLDRLVCFDGANPDPETTMTEDESSFKDIDKAKEFERGPRKGGDSKWDYLSNKVMAGRLYTAFVHGDAEGADLALAQLTNTLEWFGFIPVQPLSDYIGQMEPYSDSHAHLDKDKSIWKQVEVQAEFLAKAVKKARKEGMPLPDMLPNELQK